MSDECGGWVRQAQPLKAIFSVYLSAMEAKALGSIGEKMKAAQLVYSDEVGGAIVPEDEGDFLTQLARDVLDGVLIINFCVIIEHKVYGLIAQAPTIFDLFRIVFKINSLHLNNFQSAARYRHPWLALPARVWPRSSPISCRPKNLPWFRWKAGGRCRDASRISNTVRDL